MQTVDELICRSVKGRTSSTEEQVLLQWRQAAHANEEYYSQMTRLLAAVDSVDAAGPQLHTPAAADLITLASETVEADLPRPRRQPRRVWLVALASAAALAALMIGGFFYAQRSDPFSMGAGEYASGPNETTTATLADGTVVRLAPDSRLRIIDAPGRREVFLTGRAYLAVAPMAGRPFRVRTAVGDVVVLGTRFDVQATDELRLIVVEGKVALSAHREVVEVAAGQMSMITSGTVMQPVEVDVRPLVAWIGRFVAFQSTPLRQVAQELEREYGARVVIADPAIADMTITGTYVDRTFEEVLIIVCGVLGVECSVRDGVGTIGV